MNARSKHLVLSLAVLPVVATVGVTAASPSNAVAQRQQTMKNGSFDGGRAGWYTSSAPTKLTIAKKGRGSSRAALLTNRRTGPAILNSRSNIARSTGAGQRYTVSAVVRTTQRAAAGRMVLLETSNGQAVKNTAKRFTAVKAWRKVTMTATTRRAGSDLNVRFLVSRLKKGRSLVVDDVSVLKWLPATPVPVPTEPTPTEPTPTDPTPTDPTPTDPTPTDPTPTNPTPTNPTPTNPTPTNPTPPGGSAGHLSNGCAINARGIPGDCAALLGSAYGSNSDPTPWEKTMGQQLGVRRTYWGGTGVDSAVKTAKADLAAGRVPWISFKLPHNWADMAAGKGDAWTLDLSTKLSKLNGPVWLAFHHEPEGDGDIKQWTAMQAHLAPIVRAAAPNVAYSIVLTGYSQLYGDKQYSLDSMMPKNTKIDLVGYDVYNKYGAMRDGKEVTKNTDIEAAYFKPFQAWSEKAGVPWGIAETGYTDKAAIDDPQWVSRTFKQLRANGGVAFAYFNTTLNSVANWALTTDAKKAQFTAAIKGTPTL